MWDLYLKKILTKPVQEVDCEYPCIPTHEAFPKGKVSMEFIIGLSKAKAWPVILVSKHQKGRKGCSFPGVARKAKPVPMKGSLEWGHQKRCKRLFVTCVARKATPMPMNRNHKEPGRNGHQGSSQKAACKKALMGCKKNFSGEACWDISLKLGAKFAEESFLLTAATYRCSAGSKNRELGLAWSTRTKCCCGITDTQCSIQS